MSDRTPQGGAADPDVQAIDWHATSPALDVRALAGVVLIVPLLLAAGVYWLHHAPMGTGAHDTDSVIEVRLIGPQLLNEPRQDPTPQPQPAALRAQPDPLLDDVNRTIPAEAPSPLPREPERVSPSASPAPPASSSAAIRMPVDQIAATFQRTLLSHIARYRLYPDAAGRERARGTVQLMFAMLRDGTVTDVWVKATSGNRVLDAAALETVRRAQPLPRIPAGLPSHLNVQMPVAYDMP